MLPISWMWDILDEFLYQYQRFCEFKSKIAHRARSHEKKDSVKLDVNVLDAHPEIWESGEVLLSLKGLFNKTRGMRSEQSVYLGYFSQVQQVRYQIMHGCYHEALETVSAMRDMGRKDALYYKSPPCHCSLYYYFGFALFAVGRYSDAQAIFNKILYEEFFRTKRISFRLINH